MGLEPGRLGDQLGVCMWEGQTQEGLVLGERGGTGWPQGLGFQALAPDQC